MHVIVLESADAMPSKRSASKVNFIYYFASSLDGLIADANGGVNWLTPYQDVDRGYAEFFSSIDAAVMGRKTYERALAMLKGGPWPPPKIPYVVLSKTRTSGPHVEFWSKPLAHLPEYFRKKGSQNVWMMGGGLTAASFLNAGLLTGVRQSVRNSRLRRAGKIRSLSNSLKANRSRAASFRSATKPGNSLL